jgi:N-terminal domain of anti-restriction factor ArdC
MATNYEMIEELAMMVGYEFDGTNLKTFAEWKKEGYSVKKGEKACMKLDLWKPFTAKVKDENGKVEKDEKGNDKTETRFKLVPSSLFSIEQVEKRENGKTKAEVVALTVEVEVKEEAKEVEEIAPVEAVEVQEVAEDKEIVEMTIKQNEVTEDDIKKAYFSRKPSTAREVMQDTYKDYDRYAIMEEVVVSSKEFYDLCLNLIVDNDLFSDFKGGTFSTTDPTEEGDTRSWFELTEAERNQWQKGAYRACVKVSSKGSKFSLIIDPQGYNYARYVAIETH